MKFYGKTNLHGCEGKVKNAAVFIHPGSCFKLVEQKGVTFKIKNCNLITVNSFQFLSYN